MRFNVALLLWNPVKNQIDITNLYKKVIFAEEMQQLFSSTFSLIRLRKKAKLSLFWSIINLNVFVLPISDTYFWIFTFVKNAGSQTNPCFRFLLLIHEKIDLCLECMRKIKVLIFDIFLCFRYVKVTDMQESVSKVKLMFKVNI